MFNVNILIEGRVQGIGYRYFVKKTAESMKISGNVFNNYDGTVEINIFINTKQELEEFVQSIKSNHPMASIKNARVEIINLNPPEKEGFDIIE